MSRDAGTQDRPPPQAPERSSSGPDPSNRGERGDVTAGRGGGGRETYVGNSDSPRPPAQERTSATQQGPSLEGGQSKKPADTGPNRSEPNQSVKTSDAGQSRKPADTAPNKSEQNQSKPSKDNHSKAPAPERNRSEGRNGVAIGHPLGGRHEGRGATGPGGHGLDKNPHTKDWATHAAKDMKAAPGSPVKAMHDGKITNITYDNRADKTGKVYGDQVTIASANGAVKTFYTHMNVSQEIKDQLKANPGGVEVHRGDTIGTVAKWGDNPNESHLHVGMAARGADGSYHGVDPSAALSATENAGRDLTVTDDGGYVVGDTRYGVPPSSSEAPAASAASEPSDAPERSGRETDRDDTPGATRH